jgi:hypothetical protein
VTNAQLAMVDRALSDLETQLFPPPHPDGERPPEGDPAIPSALVQRLGARAGLATVDPVRKRLQRLQRLAQQARDAEVSLVNDALNLRAHALQQGTRVCPAIPDPAAAADARQLQPA